ncbi:hypothetical protein FE276_11510 [Salmonella bongori serovar 66:z39:-]|uniref:hypothetical protein n=1 Tax=Salmonella bongori TaxID=54736 RepID=UPI0015E7FDB7|nr:hypothetical protein [Salmonella bongori]MBA2136351.1 hypothetical protein [Salmonella bongori serovar 66:z39:-]
MTQRIAIFPADRHSLYEKHGYSAAIRSGDLLFVSGQVGSRADGTPEPDFQKQVSFPNWTAVGVNWLAGFDFEIKVIARIP